MSAYSPSEYDEHWESDPPFQIHVTTYRLGDKYYCAVDNVDPGVVISRSSGSTKAVVEQEAVIRAKERLRHTRVRNIRA
jgi:hypothetical protein